MARLPAPRCGVIRLSVGPQDEVYKGQELGVVADVLGGNPEKVIAPFDGVVIGVTLNPVVAKDGGVLHLAKPVK
jgi:predicted deacylase